MRIVERSLVAVLENSVGVVVVVVAVVEDLVGGVWRFKVGVGLDFDLEG